LRKRERCRIDPRNVTRLAICFRDETRRQKLCGVGVDGHFALRSNSGRNATGWKRVTCGTIVGASDQAAERIRGGDVGDCGETQRLPYTFVVAENESLVLLNRSAARRSKLVATKRWLGVALCVVDKA